MERVVRKVEGEIMGKVEGGVKGRVARDEQSQKTIPSDDQSNSQRGRLRHYVKV